MWFKEGELKQGCRVPRTSLCSGIGLPMANDEARVGYENLRKFTEGYGEVIRS